jgi:hypothetical protein
MVRIENRMGEMAQLLTPVRGYRTGEYDATWRARQRTVQRTEPAPAKKKNKKASCKTCSGRCCIGLCRF